MARVQSICWDCRNSTEKECEWSRDFQPVEGWEAEEKKMKNGDTSYIVFRCPKFIRDSWRYGEFRTKKEFDEAERKREENRIKNEARKQRLLEQAKQTLRENGFVFEED